MLYRGMFDATAFPIPPFLLVSSSGSDRMERLLAIRRIPKIRRNLVTANRRDKTLVRIVTRAI